MTHQQYIQQAVIKIKFEDGDVPFGYVADPTPGELNNKTVDMVECLVFGEAGGDCSRQRHKNELRL